MTNGSNPIGKHQFQMVAAPLEKAGSMRNEHLAAGEMKTSAIIAGRIEGRPPPRAEDTIAATKMTSLEMPNCTKEEQSQTLTVVQRSNRTSVTENCVGSSPLLDEWQLRKPQKYFKTIYIHMPLESNDCDAVLNCHPNGLVVVCLAPYHPAILKAVKGKCQVQFRKSLNVDFDQLKGRK